MASRRSRSPRRHSRNGAANVRTKGNNDAVVATTRAGVAAAKIVSAVTIVSAATIASAVLRRRSRQSPLHRAPRQGRRRKPRPRRPLRPTMA
jgi:hypothetical protein